MSHEKLTGLLEHLACSLAHSQDEVSVVTEETDNAIKLTLKVAQEDMGRVIGKGGKTAKAIRTVMKAASDPRGKRVVVEISE